MKINELLFPVSARTDKLRTQALHQWMTRHMHSYKLMIDSLQHIADEASNRRYYRIQSTHPSLSFIIMDSAPWFEDNAAFVAIAGLLASASISVPAIYEWDEALGFLLLEDMGKDTLLELNLRNDWETVRRHYYRAVNTLLEIQLHAQPDRLPTFSPKLMRQEMELFTHWHLNKNLSTDLKDGLQFEIAACFDLITQKNQEISQVFVHRDYRPGNLIVSGDGQKISVIDFQDAVKGPITYDLVSLMWDSFHCWDDKFIAQIIFHYWSSALTKHLPVPPTFSDFEDHIYWTCLQRHLRVIGIFARLGIREGKIRYLQEIHRFNNYLISHKSHDKRMQPLIELLNRIHAQPYQ